MVKEYYKVKDSNKDQFAGDGMNYLVWRQRFIATVHSKRMLIFDKALALSTALDNKVDLLGNMIRGLHYDPKIYATLIAELERLYGGADQEIATTALYLFKGAKVQLSSRDLVRAFRVKLQAYRATLDKYHKREAGFVWTGQLYRDIQDRKFT
jgi:hypothetical protein